VLLFVLPGHAVVIVWAFTAAVAITAAQRVVFGVRLLRAPGAEWPPPRRPAQAATVTPPLSFGTKIQQNDAEA
jgi:hypothetical protein